MSTLAVILFFGGWLPPSFLLCYILWHALMPFYLPFEFVLNLEESFPFLGLISSSLILAIKVLLMIFFFLWVRASFPRYRYDQLMQLGWKRFLPISLAYVVLTSSILMLIDGLPAAN